MQQKRRQLIAAAPLNYKCNRKPCTTLQLREIGKRDFNYNEKALLLAHEFAESDSKALNLIGKDAIKELETLVKEEGRGRLILSKSQIGKEADASEA